MIRATTLALVLVLCSPALANDTVEVKSGRVVTGKIVRDEKAWIGVETDSGIVWVKRSEVKSITRVSEPAPAPTPVTDDEPGPEGKKGADVVVPRPLPTQRAGAESAGSTPKKPRADDERLSAEARKIRELLASEEREDRIRATEWIVETWPKWRSALEYALASEPSEKARVETVRVLDREEIEDVGQLVDVALEDASSTVRMAALRVVRHRGLGGAETRAVELMRTDPTWAVRQEAIRTLEDIGGSMCLPHVMAAWSGETDRDKKRRYRRVMKALLGDDFGDDAAAWYGAADELFMGDREIRKGKKKTKGD